MPSFASKALASSLPFNCADSVLLPKSAPALPAAYNFNAPPPGFGSVKAATIFDKSIKPVLKLAENGVVNEPTSAVSPCLPNKPDKNKNRKNKQNNNKTKTPTRTPENTTFASSSFSLTDTSSAIVGSLN